MALPSVSESYDVTLKPVTSVTELAEQWHQLENLVRPPFFLSWAWQSAWLANANKQLCWCIQVYYQRQLVALAVGGVTHQRVKGLFPVKRFSLNASGFPEYDQQWIEYNDLLCLPDHEKGAKLSAINTLFSQLNVDECVIGMSQPEQLQLWQRHYPWRQLITTYGYRTALQAGGSRQPKDNGWSKNTRYKIRRSTKKLQQQAGSLHLQMAQTSSEALEFFHRAADWHIQRWSDTDSGSGFTNPSFIRFHEHLIQTDLNCQRVNLCKITAGDHTLGFIYLFCEKTQVCFYLSSINPYWMTNQIQAGLVMHDLVMQHYAPKGLAYYDFLAGDARYKRSLSTERYEMAMIALQRPNLKSKVLNMLRLLKRSLNG